MFFNKKLDKLLIIFFFAFILRLFLLSFFYNQPLNIVDEQHYNKLAISLLERGEFGWAPGRLTAIRPPLYPAFLCAIYKIFGSNSHNAIRLIQIFLSLASGWLVYSLAKKMFREEKVALLASGLFLFYPSLVIFNYLILTETLFIFLFLLALWFLVSGIERSLRGLTAPRDDRDEIVSGPTAPRNDKVPGREAWHLLSSPACPQQVYGDGKAWFFLFLAGIFWGLASLTRSVTYPLVPLIGLFLFLIWPKKRQGLVAATIFVTAVVLTLSPWMIRNYRVFGHFVAVDTMGGLNLYMGNYEYTPLHRAWAAVDNPPGKKWSSGHAKELQGLNEAEKQRWAIKKALEFMKEHPGLTALRTVIKTANFWQLERTIIAGMQRGYFPGLRNKLVEILIAVSILGTYVLVAILGFCGIIWRFTTWHMVNGERRQKNREWLLSKASLEPKKQYVDWLIALIIFYFTAIHAIVFGHSRYHLPLIPFLCIYVAYILIYFEEILRTKRNHFWRLILLVCMIFALIWSYDIFIGSYAKVLSFLKEIF